VSTSVLDIDVDLPEYAQPLFQPFRYKVCYGGRGAARSWSFAIALLLLSTSRPLRVLCAREMQRSILDSVHKLLVDTIDRLHLPGFDVTQRSITHQNGSIFMFEGLRYNITKIKSMEGIDICWVEEAERVSKESWDVLIPTIRKPGSEIWVTFNPDLEEDATYQRFVVRPPPNSWVKEVSWLDNPWFGQTEMVAEKDYLYSVDPEAADHVWGGQTRKHSKASVLHGKWVVDRFDVEPGWSGPYNGLDFGFASDPTAAMECWIAPSVHPMARKMRLPGRLFIRKEMYKLHLETDQIYNTMRATIDPAVGKRTWRCDAARPETISFLKKHGMPQAVAAVKWPGSIEDGIGYLRSFEQIIIHPECPNAAQEARLWRYKVDPNTEEVLPVLIDKHNNTWDAVRYALAPIIRMRRKPKRPYTGGTYTGN
jgi:phage terminase large subunit